MVQRLCEITSACQKSGWVTAGAEAARGTEQDRFSQFVARNSIFLHSMGHLVSPVKTAMQSTNLGPACSYSDFPKSH